MLESPKGKTVNWKNLVWPGTNSHEKAKKFGKIST